MDIRSFFKKEKDEANDRQPRLDLAKEELSPVADRLGKSKV